MKKITPSIPEKNRKTIFVQTVSLHVTVIPIICYAMLVQSSYIGLAVFALIIFLLSMFYLSLLINKEASSIEIINQKTKKEKVLDMAIKYAVKNFENKKRTIKIFKRITSMVLKTKI